MRALVTLIMTLSMLGPALAQPATTARKPRPIMELEAVKIKGERHLPQAFYILERSALGGEPREALERSTIPLILKRADDLLER